MERFELLNMALAPLDWLLKAYVLALKTSNTYEPFKHWLLGHVRSSMINKFRDRFDLEIIEEDNVPDTGGVIVAANHQSWLDAQVLGATSKRRVHFIAKAMFKDWPILPIFYELNETLYVTRGGDTQGIQEVVDNLRAGRLVGIFPEGTIPGEEEIPRTALDPRTGLLKGKTGMVRMAVQARVPIVPLGISGTGPAFPPEAYPRLEMPPVESPHPITLRYGKPIHFDVGPQELTRERLRELTEHVMQKISQLVDHRRCVVPIRELPMSPVKPLGYSPRSATKAPFGVLVLHGFTSALECVSSLAPHLRKRKIPYRIPILRGHSTQPQQMVGTTHQHWYADAEQALLELSGDAERIIVCGLSMGALVSLQLGMEHRELISHLVLLAPALKLVDPLVRLTPLLSRVFKFWPSPSPYHDQQLALENNLNYRIFATDAFASLYEYTGIIERRLGEIVQPVRILQSRVDQIVAPRSANLIHDGVASADREIVWFDQSGHEMLLDLEADRVRRAVEQYIDRVVEFAWR